MATIEEYKNLKSRGVPDREACSQLGFPSVYALDKWKRKNKVKNGRNNQYTVGGKKRGK